MDLKTTILLFALIFALAAVFVLWAKWEEEKLKTREERENYLAALRLHNTMAEALDRSEEQQRCSAQAVLWYADHLAGARVIHENLQDRLSALLCPHNDHVWEGGRCAKCGRVKE